VQTNQHEIFESYVTITNLPCRISIDLHATSGHFLGKITEEKLLEFSAKENCGTLTPTNLRMSLARFVASFALVIGPGVLR